MAKGTANLSWKMGQIALSQKGDPVVMTQGTPSLLGQKGHIFGHGKWDRLAIIAKGTASLSWQKGEIGCYFIWPR